MRKHFLTHFAIVVFFHLLVLIGGVGLFELENHGTLKKTIGSVMVHLDHFAAKVNEPQKRPAPKLPSKTSAAVTETAQEASAPSQETSPVNSQSGTQAATLKDLFKAELRSRIDQNKTYPLMSRKLGQTGTVVVAFTMLKDGSIINVRIEDPAPFSALNKSALEAVLKVGKFKPIPEELHEDKMELSIPIKFLTF